MPTGMSIALYSNSIMKLFCMFVENVGRGMKECLITNVLFDFGVPKKIHVTVCSGSTVILFSSLFCQR